VAESLEKRPDMSISWHNPAACLNHPVETPVFTPFFDPEFR
jgi:hypothetical protein